MTHELRSRFVGVGSLLLVVTALLGCRAERQECFEPQASAVPIDSGLMAFLSRARAAHHAADLREDSPEQAMAPLLALVNGPTPPAGEPRAMPAEVREVLADTHARIADLESQLERFEAAYRRIETALNYVPEMSYFRGHLFETEGVVAQRQSAALTSKNAAAEAAGARSRALKAFETAMEIQATVIRNAPPHEPSTLSQSPNPTPRSSASNTDGTSP